ncbi:unnamed protein product [Orchesella dallaii]|uniref:Uncharacterized protein n=1 Tax=Orchesella dallaii TaxID=48710 RepID=A0ABP1R865_9HEXA
MRKYITEKIGIVEIFQIILIIIMLAIGYHAFAQDLAWNKKVEMLGSNICVEINLKLQNSTKDLPTALRESLCPLKSQIIQQTCDIEEYLTKSNNPKEYWSLIKNNLIRTQASQNTFLGLITIAATVLIIHMIVANITKNVNVRTKWNAAMQGVILFGCGFAVMLLAISTNAMDLKYRSFLALEILPQCKLLTWCDKTLEFSQPKSHKVKVEKALEAFGACQAYTLKNWSCILLGVMIFACLAMILMAMELTTKYEEEEEKEAIAKNARGEMDVLLQDENVIFDTDGGVSDEILPGQRSSKNTRFHRRRSSLPRHGSHILEDYMRDRHHHDTY